ncbi:MAG: hypothetical protein ABIH41_01385 [Nanoarchaeota archaeon]
MNIDAASMQRTVKSSEKRVEALYADILEYFMGCTKLQKYAWGLFGLGLVLITIAVILW